MTSIEINREAARLMAEVAAAFGIWPDDVRISCAHIGGSLWWRVETREAERGRKPQWLSQEGGDTLAEAVAATISARAALRGPAPSSLATAAVLSAGTGAEPGGGGEGGAVMDEPTMAGFESFGYVGHGECGIARTRFLFAEAKRSPTRRAEVAALLRAEGWRCRAHGGRLHPVTARDVAETTSSLGQYRFFTLDAAVRS